ncbi:helix-turn-helix domain-containing protein [Methylophilus glucosoxydans]|uniref:Helix-turn-helix domain-containing protein n=1 Tax=Methylophilus glucosoxydans TaxID=752553 RepID=A0ABW3GK31_9PROT
MTPFSIALKEIRSSRDLKQRKCAEIIGWEPSYLSSLETGYRPPPQTKGINHLVKKLGLSIEEAQMIREAADRSREVLKIPRQIDLKKREALLRFAEYLPRMTQDELAIISLTLNISAKTQWEEHKM